MAVTGTLYLTGTIVGEPEGSSDIALSWPITNGLSAAAQLDLASGDNAITVPAGVTLIVIIPPPLNTETIEFRLAGATEQPMAPNLPTVISRDAGAGGTLTITAGDAVAGFKVLFI